MQDPWGRVGGVLEMKNQGLRIQGECPVSHPHCEAPPPWMCRGCPQPRPAARTGAGPGWGGSLGLQDRSLLPIWISQKLTVSRARLKILQAPPQGQRRWLQNSTKQHQSAGLTGVGGAAERLKEDGHPHHPAESAPPGASCGSCGPWPSWPF